MPANLCIPTLFAKIWYYLYALNILFPFVITVRCIKPTA